MSAPVMKYARLEQTPYLLLADPESGEVQSAWYPDMDTRRLERNDAVIADLARMESIEPAGFLGFCALNGIDTSVSLQQATVGDRSFFTLRPVFAKGVLGKARDLLRFRKPPSPLREPGM